MDTEKLTKERLPTAQAVFSVGLLAVKELQTAGVVTLFVNKDGEVEICPYWEVRLDSLTEDKALEALMERGYQDYQLADYLKGRDAREAIRDEDMRPVAV